MADMEWRCVVGVSGYEVSSTGLVRSWLPLRNYAPTPTEPRILKPSIDKNGYRTYALQVGPKKKKYIRGGAMVAEAWHGGRPDGMVVRHLDGSKNNDTPSNLRWGTPKENSNDSKVHGTYIHGAKVNTAKLSIDDVLMIKASTKGHAELSKELGVSPGAIWHIRDGRTWKHVA